MPAHRKAGSLRSLRPEVASDAVETRVVTLIALLRMTAHVMVDELVDRLDAAGYADVAAAQHPVLENIDRDGTRLTTLSARAGITHQSMGELVAALERNGYLERRPDPFDRRARLVCLTRKGRALVRRAIHEISDIEATWLERFMHAGLHADLHDVLQTALVNPP